MGAVLSALLAGFARLFRSHLALQLEMFAVRHQLAVYQRTLKRPSDFPSDRRAGARGSHATRLGISSNGGSGARVPVFRSRESLHIMITWAFAARLFTRKRTSGDTVGTVEALPLLAGQRVA